MCNPPRGKGTVNYLANSGGREILRKRSTSPSPAATRANAGSAARRAQQTVLRYRMLRNQIRRDPRHVMQAPDSPSLLEGRNKYSSARLRHDVTRSCLTTPRQPSSEIQMIAKGPETPIFILAAFKLECCWAACNGPCTIAI